MEKFFTTGIPQVLEPRPVMDRRLLTLEQVETIMEHNDRAIIPVSGDCLEGAQVMDGGWVAVDFTHFPAPPRYKNRGGDDSEDLCMCYAVFPGQRTPAVMCKAYTGVWGPWQMVGTHYDLSKGKHPYPVAGYSIFKVNREPPIWLPTTYGEFKGVLHEKIFNFSQKNFSLPISCLRIPMNPLIICDCPDTKITE